MNFAADKSVILNSINTVTKALPQKTAVAVIEGILFQIQDGKVKLSCTDLSMTIEDSFGAEISDDTPIVLNGKLIGEIVRKMPNGEIRISGNEQDGVVISGQGSKISIMSMKADDFPQLPHFTKAKSYSLQQGLLKQMINQTIFAAAPEGFIRQILTGCLFEINGNTFNIVALDTVRLALRSAEIEGENEPLRAVVPCSALNEISKILSDEDTPVEVYFNKSNALFSVGSTNVFTRLYEGEYLKYQSFIPTVHDLEFTVSRAELLDSIDRAWLMARENVRNNYILFSIDKEKLVITSRSESGNVYEVVNINGCNKDLQIAFNAKYFVDCLKNINDEVIRLCMTTNRSPCLIKPVDNDRKVYLILPVKV